MFVLARPFLDKKHGLRLALWGVFPSLLSRKSSSILAGKHGNLNFRNVPKFGSGENSLSKVMFHFVFPRVL